MEFGTNYVSKKKRTQVEPSSMLTYIRGIQRRLHELALPVHLFESSIFANPDSGLVAALDNKFVHQQSSGLRTRSHNILTVDDIEKIFSSEHCNATPAEGFRNKLVFAVGIALGARTTEV